MKKRLLWSVIFSLMMFADCYSSTITPGINPDIKGPAKPKAGLSSANTQSDRWDYLPEHHSPKIGWVNSVVVFIRFADQTEFPATKNYSSWDTDFNADNQVTPSLKGYFKETSNQLLNITSHLRPYPQNGLIVSWQCPETYMEILDSFDGDIETHLYQPAIEWLQNSGTLAGIDLDNDNNGIVDNLVFVIRGSSLYTFTQDWQSFWGNYPSLMGKSVRQYTTIKENDFSIGNLAEEYLNSCGVPDFHGEMNGAWHVRNAGPTPVHMSTYIKSHYMGWISTPMQTPDNTYTLAPVSQNTGSSIRVSSNDPNQYYVLEYRKKEGVYESYIPNSGLIIYRIDQRCLGDGVPDANPGYSVGYEQIVYGPIITPGTPFANLDQAMLSIDYGRPTFDRYTNPAPYLQDLSMGNLVVTDISSPGPTGISFRLRWTEPKTWKGEVSSDWHNATNWWNGIPMSTDDVEIPVGASYNPAVSSWTSCQNLIIYNGASLTINASDLVVNGNLTMLGNLEMSGSGDLHVFGNLTWGKQSFANITSLNNDIKVQGNVTFHSDCNANLLYGTLEFWGNGVSILEVRRDTQLNTLISNKNSGWALSFSSNNSGDTIINGDLNNQNQSRLYGNSNYNIYLKGNFNSASSAYFQFYTGTLILQGNGKQLTDSAPAGTNFFNILKLEQGSQPQAPDYTLTGDITTLDLVFLAGTLHAGSHSIYVRGNWNDISGNGFDCGTGRVIFNGWADQNCSSETFAGLTINKSSGLVLIAAAIITCQSYQNLQGGYKVIGGAFLASDLEDPAIQGTVILEGGFIDYTQNSWQYIDLKGNITISDGTFSIHGGNGPSDWPWGGAASLTMSGGIFDWHDVGIRIGNDNTFSASITGGNIRCGAGLEINRTDFNPSGGTITMQGTQDGTLYCASGSSLFNLSITKTLSRNLAESRQENGTDKDGRQFPITRNGGINCNSYLTLNGTLHIYTGILSSSNTIRLSGDFINEAGLGGFVNSGGTVEFYYVNNQHIAGSTSFNILVLNKSSGALMIDDASTTVNCASYLWQQGYLMVQSGIFSAADLAQNGIAGNYYLYNGGTINLHQDSAQYTDLNGYLTIYGGTLNVYGGNGDSFWPYSSNAGITMFGGILYFHSVGINIYNTSAFSLDMSIQGGTIRTVGSFQVNRSGFTPVNSNLVMLGANDATISCVSGSYFYNLEINKASSRLNPGVDEYLPYSDDRFGNRIPIRRSNTVSASSDLLIKGDFALFAGTFAAPALMKVEGDWLNELVGQSGFNEGAGSVEFCGNGEQTIYSSTEMFNILKLNNATGSLTSRGCVACASYDWMGGALHVANGSFSANDLVQNGIFGSYTIDDTCTLNLTQDSGQYIDLNGFITNINGTVNIFGGSSASDWSYSANAGVTMASGTIDFRNNGINFYSGAHSFANNISGGLVRTTGSFGISRSSFHLNCPVELYGTGAAYFYTGSTSSLQKLIVSKTGSGYVQLSSIAKVSGDIVINSGSLQQNINNLYLGGDLINNATDTAFDGGSATLYLNGTNVNQTFSGCAIIFNLHDLRSGIGSIIVQDGITVNGIFTMASDTQIHGPTNIWVLRNQNQPRTFAVSEGVSVLINACYAGGRFEVTGGSLNVTDLYDNGIYGVWYLNSGQISLHQDSEHYIDLNGNITIDDGIFNIYGGSGPAYTAYDGNCSLAMNGGALFLHNQGLWIPADGAFTFTSSLLAGEIHLAGSLVVERQDFRPATAIVMEGSQTAYLSIMNGSTLNDLRINKSSRGNEGKIPAFEGMRDKIAGLRRLGDNDLFPLARDNSVTLSTNVTVTGSIYILSGVLNALNWTIHLYGDWVNSMGSSGFEAGNSLVSFEGNANSTIQENGAFANVLVNKPNTGNDKLIIASNRSLSTEGYLYVLDGQLHLDDPSTLSIGGLLYLAAGAGIRPNSNTITLFGSWTDDNPTFGSTWGFDPQSSTLIAEGSMNAAFNTSGSRLHFHNLTVNKGDASLSTLSPITVYGDMNLSSGTWGDNSNGISYLYGDFIATSGTLAGSSQSTLCFTGISAQNINYASSTGYFANLSIVKPLSPVPGSSQTVTLQNSIYIFGNMGLTISSGVLLTNHYNLRVDGNVSIQGGAKLALESSSLFKIGADKTLAVLDGGILECLGTAVNPVRITSYDGSGFYDFGVESGGTLSASYAIFEKMKTDGVNIKSGAIISSEHPLSNCTFQDGYASGALLTLNSNQSITIPGIILPSNTWSGTYNVKKSSDQGSVNFTGALGSFAGPNYEYDPYNRLTWEGFVPDLQYSSHTLSSSNLVAGDSVRVYVNLANNSEVDVNTPFYVDCFVDPAGTPPPGTAGDFRVMVWGLIHGMTNQVSFGFQSTTATTKNIYIRVDGVNSIAESNENNNTSPQISLIWQPLPESITLLSPNGGENWTAGTRQMISWNTLNTSVWNISYSINNGADWIPIRSAFTQSPYEWTVPDNQSAACRIKISNQSGSVYDISDASFSILEDTTPLMAPGNVQIIADTLSGDILITWTAVVGNPSGYRIYCSSDPLFPPDRTFLAGNTNADTCYFTDTSVFGEEFIFYRVTAYR